MILIIYININLHLKHLLYNLCYIYFFIICKILFYLNLKKNKKEDKNIQY